MHTSQLFTWVLLWLCRLSHRWFSNTKDAQSFSHRHWSNHGSFQSTETETSLLSFQKEASEPESAEMTLKTWNSVSVKSRFSHPSSNRARLRSGELGRAQVVWAVVCYRGLWTCRVRTGSEFSHSTPRLCSVGEPVITADDLIRYEFQSCVCHNTTTTQGIEICEW